MSCSRLSKGEQRRLGLEEADWNLPGASNGVLNRTRGGGSGRPDLERTTKWKYIDNSEVVNLADEQSHATEPAAEDASGSEEEAAAFESYLGSFHARTSVSTIPLSEMWNEAPAEGPDCLHCKQH
jgi:hypothetical protein